MPMVTVIVNAHNGGRTLAQTLDSVCAQTFTDYEFILWDDASRDDTLAVAARYVPKGLRILRTAGEAPLGLGAARQAAIDAAQGRWIAFIDQDDLWLPQALSLMVTRAGSDERVGMVYGRTLRFWPDGRERDFDHAHEHGPLPEGDLFLRLFEESCFICISGVLLRRDALQQVGPVPPQVRIVPDYYFFLGIARRWEVRAVQQVTCRYRMHATSMTQGSRGKMQAEILWLIERWASEIGPALARRRQQVHATVWAVDELFRPGQRRQGLRRLWREGSTGFLLSRPVAWMMRAVRRRLFAPAWKQHGLAA